MKTANIDEMKNYLRENNLTHLVRELADGSGDSTWAIKWVYDSHTLSKEEFRRKYFG